MRTAEPISQWAKTEPKHACFITKELSPGCGSGWSGHLATRTARARRSERYLAGAWVPCAKFMRAVGIGRRIRQFKYWARPKHRAGCGCVGQEERPTSLRFRQVSVRSP